MHYLNEYAPELLRKGVMEERIDGEHYQFDGVVLDGEVQYLSMIRQEWNTELNKITKYVLADHPVWIDSIYKAIHAIGLDNSPFCVEIVVSPSRVTLPYIIEVNARLGEDTRLPDIICGGEDPLKKIEEICNAE